jgi:hypothetical protein
LGKNIFLNLINVKTKVIECVNLTVLPIFIGYCTMKIPCTAKKPGRLGLMLNLRRDDKIFLIKAKEQS